MLTDHQHKNNTKILGIFTDHPAQVGESYGQHFMFALRFSARLFFAAGAALIHALIPALCETTASRCITNMHKDLTARHKDD